MYFTLGRLLLFAIRRIQNSTVSFANRFCRFRFMRTRKEEKNHSISSRPRVFIFLKLLIVIPFRHFQIKLHNEICLVMMIFICICFCFCLMKYIRIDSNLPLWTTFHRFRFQFQLNEEITIVMSKQQIRKQLRYAKCLLSKCRQHIAVLWLFLNKKSSIIDSLEIRWMQLFFSKMEYPLNW